MGSREPKWRGNEEETINTKVFTRFSLDSGFFAEICKSRLRAVNINAPTAPQVFAVDDHCTRSTTIGDHQANANTQSSNTVKRTFLNSGWVRCKDVVSDSILIPLKHKSQTW